MDDLKQTRGTYRDYCSEQLDREIDEILSHAHVD